MSTEKYLQNKQALVTGGTRGIGFSTACKLAELGAKVTVTGTHEFAKNHNYNELKERGFSYLKADFSDQHSWESFLQQLDDYPCDILVNSAGINPLASFEKITPKLLEEVLSVNLKSPFFLAQKVLPKMIAKNSGKIINICSIWSFLSKSNRLAYTMSKFALDGMTVTLAAEVSRYNIQVNSVSPGFIDTDLTRKNLGEEGIAKITKIIPAKKLGSTSDIAELVAWLASDKSTYISGQNMVVDGGFSRVRETE